jgi:hypothetical protein
MRAQSRPAHPTNWGKTMQTVRPARPRLTAAIAVVLALATTLLASSVLPAAADIPVPFDDLSAAHAISGSTGTSSASTVGATGQVGEPSVACAGESSPGALNSVWFKWTAPSTGQFQFDTLGSDYDTFLNAYIGSTIGSLVQRACNDNIPLLDGSVQSAVFFNVVAGNTYRIRVDGAGTSTGSATLNWRPTPTISASGFAAYEGDSGRTTKDLPVTLSAATTVPVAIDYGGIDIPTNTAVAANGVDYDLTPGTLVFQPGETVKNISVDIIGDTIEEPPLLWGEWGLVQLTNPRFTTVTGGFFGAGLFIIFDDDSGF